MEPKSSQPQAFYRWVDSEGRLHVVTSLDSVPRSERAKAERVTFTGETTLGGAPSATSSEWRLEPGSFGLGFAAALLISLLFRLLPNGWRSLTRIAVVLGIAALLTGLYLGGIRRTTGAGGASLATPSALIEDAKAAVEKLNQRQKQQDEELRQLQTEGR
jgi:hypothetical protein